MKIIQLLLLIIFVIKTNPVRAEETSSLNITNRAIEGTINALTFSQNDLDSFLDAKNYFTFEGWKKFLKNKKYWLNEKGAPIYNSKFLPVRLPPEIFTENGRTKIKITGDLIQSQRSSETRYRARIDIDINEAGKILNLIEQINADK